MEKRQAKNITSTNTRTISATKITNRIIDK
jgi:hypothetical protein